MNANEEVFIKNQVKVDILPEVKKVIPGVIGFLLRLIFPKIEAKLVERIKVLFDALLNGQADA